jgi:calcineurin-like phosphoesterase family protein
MKTYVGSDFHWGHKNIMGFCPVTRAKYKDLTHMNETMIQEWNAIVEPGDLVYMLGDVAFMSGFDASKIVNRLNGDKILIEGNHDVKTLKDVHFYSAFKEVHKYHEIVYEGTKVCMFHYPIAEWNQMHRGSVMLHGHLHGGVSGMEKYRSRDMGMDATGKILTLMEDAIADAIKGEIKNHHH